MQIYGKIEDGFVTEIVMAKNWTPPSGEEAMWEIVPDNVELGWEKVGDDFNDDAIQWEAVRKKQRDMIVAWSDVLEIHEREVAHDDTLEADYTITPAKYQELLSYFQTVRQNDEELHATPQDALAALDALVVPTV